MRRLCVTVSALIFVAVAVGMSGCSQRKDDDGTKPMAITKELPALTIKDDTQNLLLTWIDDKGDMHVELAVTGVPAEGRSLVRVIVSDREEGTKDAFYVVDLSSKGVDGGYVAKTMSRRAWESEIEKRRSTYLAKNAPPTPKPAGSAASDAPPTNDRGDKPPAITSSVTAIIYGASWCKPCHDVEKYLKAKGVRIVHKDIEEDRSAALEMRDKLQKSGQRGGSIPVVDVAGQILVGFSPRELDRALAKASGGTAL